MQRTPQILLATFALSFSGCAPSTREPAGGDRSLSQTGANAASPAFQDESTIVLFDGTAWIGWIQRDGMPSAWKVQSDGSVEVHGGDAISLESYGDFQLHLEFLCPSMPDRQGQARANSGVYLHGRYELQVLDSFGQPVLPDGCGGIYGIASPLVNASLPGGEWQTYDIVFRAPRLDDGNHVLELPRVTVIHNGVVIHNNLHITGTTGGAIDNRMSATGPILLQDHGDKVRYRNIRIRRL